MFEMFWLFWWELYFHLKAHKNSAMKLLLSSSTSKLMTTSREHRKHIFLCCLRSFWKFFLSYSMHCWLWLALDVAYSRALLCAARWMNRSVNVGRRILCSDETEIERKMGGKKRKKKRSLNWTGRSKYVNFHLTLAKLTRLLECAAE